VDPKVREMELDGLEEHCAGLGGGGVEVRCVAKRREGMVVTGGDQGVIDVLLPVMDDGSVGGDEGVVEGGGVERAGELELVNRLYRMSSSSSSLSSGGSCFGGDGGDGGDGGSWE